MSFESIAYKDGEVALTGHAMRPLGKAKAAVAVFPTIANITPAVEAKARALVEAGYVILICDFYGAMPADMTEAFAWADELRDEAARYRSRLRAGLAALERLAPELPKIAIGFCMGGQAVLELARDGAELMAVASFHGLLDTKRPAEPGTVKARILVCHGDADPMVPRSQVLAFWEEMDRAGADWHFHAYAGVKHGFTNPNPPVGADAVAYNESADRQSWQSALSLFDEVLEA